MNIKVKKHNVVFFIVLFLMVSVLGALYVKGGVYTQIVGEYETIDVDSYILGSNGYDYQDGTYTVIEGDPHVLLGFGEKPIYGVRLNVKEPINGSSIQFYFGRGDGGFMESDSRIFSGSDIKSVEMIGISSFNYLRVDINEDFAIESMEVCYEVEAIPVSHAHQYVIMLVLNALVIGAAAVLLDIEKIYNRKTVRLQEIVEKTADDKKGVLTKCLQVIGCVIGAAIIELVWYHVAGDLMFNKYRMFFIAVILLIVVFTVWYKKSLYKYTHIYFFVVAMLLGTTQVVVSPTVVGVSWDDEIHYAKCAFLSWGAEGISEADQMLVDHYQDVIFNRAEYDYDGRVKWNIEINEFAKENSTLSQKYEYTLSHQYVAYLPAGIGLRLGRGLGLSFSTTFMLGKWVNVLCYTLCMSFAIKILKRGKLIAAAIGLIPTNLFLAASYSYDWWVTASIVLGFALFLGDVQRNKPVSTKKFACIMLIMIIGMLPKAVYFPLIFPLMLFKKERYENSKLCRWMVVGAMLILVASFILPMFANSTDSLSDSRGGSDVNSTEQIRFILTKPLEYTKILLTFLYNYLSLDTSLYYLTFFAYMGQAPFYTLCIMAIAICCAFDNMLEKNDAKESWLTNGAAMLGAFGALVLSATALYISFTPVAHPTILGCQWRYIIPVIFPVLFFITRAKVEVSEVVRKNAMMIAVITMTFVYMNGLYMFCI